MMIKSTRKTINIYKNILQIVILALMSSVIVIPLYLAFINSFKNDTESALLNLSLPSRWLFSNYPKVIEEGRIIRAMLNGVIISSGTVIICILVSSMAAFILIRRRSKVNSFLYNLFIAGLMAPLTIVPEIKILQLLHVMNTYQGIILVLSGVNIPFSVFLFTGFINSIPKEIDESGTIDGCKSFRLFFKLIFPLLKPVIFTNLIVVAMNSWNDFQLSLYFLSNRKLMGMQLTVYNFVGQYTNNWNLVCADLILTITPIIIVYIFAQKYIISGMTAGAVKG